MGEPCLGAKYTNAIKLISVEEKKQEKKIHPFSHSFWEKEQTKKKGIGSGVRFITNNEQKNSLLY